MIQRNALESWTRLEPKPEILLFGDDEGAAEIARELGPRHVPQVAQNEYGTPLIGDIFEQAQKLATHRHICYVNADIILLPDLMRAVEFVARKKREFLLVGQRTDLDITEPIDFGDNDWQSRLRADADENGAISGPQAIDYFVFPKGALGTIPPFAIGRWVWDNWLLYQARRRRIALVDATKAVLCIHQNHNYNHIADRTGGASAWDWPETKANVRLAGGPWAMYQLDDATYEATIEADRLALRGLYSLRHAQRSAYSLYHTNRLIGAARAVARLLRSQVRGAGRQERA